MTQQTIQKKILALESEIKAIKRAVSDRPDFIVDEKLWKEFRASAKKARRRIYGRYHQEK